MPRPILNHILLFALVPLAMAGPARAGSYTETFSTLAFADTIQTTALWDTSTGTLTLPPFVPAAVGSVDTPGNARFLELAGNYAYLTDASSGLQVVDISDPESPFIAGSYGPTSNTQGVAVYGDYVYLADGSPGILVIDVGDPTNPSLAGSYNPTSFPSKITVGYGVAAVPSGSDVDILDLSDPVNPALVGSVGLPGAVVADLVIQGTLVYVSDYDSGLQIVDISNPASPSVVGSVDTPGLAFGVAVDGATAYVADYDEGLHVIDVADPANPALLGSLDTPGNARELDASGNRVYLADGSFGLQVIDVTDPANPVLLHTVDTPGTATAARVAGAHAFVADSGDGLRTIRVAEPAGPLFLGNPFVSGAALAAEVAGDYAYVAASNAGLRILDITDPTSLVQAGSYVPPGSPVADDIAVSGNLAVMAVGDSGAVFLDVTDRSAPTPLSTYGGARVYSVALDGNLALLGLGSSGGLVALDVSNPSAPVVLDSLGGFIDTDDIEINGPWAYVASEISVVVVDISDPTSMTQVSSALLCLCTATGLAASGNLVYVTHSGTAGLSVIDVSDPANPVRYLETFTTTGLGAGVDVSGDVAAVVTGSGYVHLLDVSDPQAIMEIGTYRPPGTGSDISLSGHLAFSSQGFGDLAILEVLQDERDPAGNLAWSLPVDDGDGTILRGRITPTFTGPVTWRLSADGGSNIQNFSPGSWDAFGGNAGTDLVWFATLDYPAEVDEVTVEWLYDYASITNVTDVPNDQGRQVRVEWQRSGHDFVGDPDQIVEYAVYRQIDPNLAATAGTRAVPVTASASVAHHASLMQEAGWDFITTVPVRVQDAYAVVVPTLADSTPAAGPYETTFLVSALTAAPGVFYDSPPASGYSLDNLAPGVPQGFAAGFGQGTVSLAWDPAPEEDFQYHRVYRSTDPGFTPGPATLVHETAATQWEDAPAEPWTVFYKVTTVDVAGNESLPASSGGVVATPNGPERPERTMLLGAHPNPLRTGTRISFDLSRDEPVSLQVFDVAGRLVRSLVSESLPAGRHEVRWDGTDESRDPVASGVYLYRLQAGGVHETRRVVLVR